MERPDPSLVERLVRDLLGSDAARCGDAHARLVALGGFDRREIRDVLDRIVREESALPGVALPGVRVPSRLMPPRGQRTVGGWVLGDCLGRGAFGAVHCVEEGPDGGPEDRLCVKLTRGPGGPGSVAVEGRANDAPSADAVTPDRVLACTLVDRPGLFRCGDVGAEEAAELLLWEFHLLRELDSDLFPEVRAAGLQDGTAWYAMERIAADDLRRHMSAGVVDRLDLRRLFRRLLRELEGLRSRRGDFCHGDLKPENILVTPHRLRLVDPGFRGDAEAPVDAVLSVPYNPLGHTGEKADTGALALTLLEALTGLQPLRRRKAVWRPDDGLDPAATLPLDLYLPFADRDPLVARLLRFVAEPPSYVAFAAALER